MSSIAKRVQGYFKRKGKPQYISNYFHSNFKKNLLISYITEPFVYGVNHSHSNKVESLEIARIFRDKLFNVDIIQHDAPTEKINFNKKYDLIFGLEPNFLKLVNKFKPHRSIYYATGAYYGFQNIAELMRIEDLQERRHTKIKPRRVVSPHNSSDLADGVICFGNKWTKSTYKGHCKKIAMIRISAHPKFPFSSIRKGKNWDEARKNFLWFGSTGAVHKGLDLILEIFSHHPELNLFVCGTVKQENDFYQAYRKELLKTANIHLVGWVNPDSVEYEELLIKCAYSILPSCSEGMSGSVATCMHSGLIPLISKECGIDSLLSGTVFKDNSVDTIEKTIMSASNTSPELVEKNSQETSSVAEANFTLEKFRSDFIKGLETIL